MSRREMSLISKSMAIVTIECLDHRTEEKYILGGSLDPLGLTNTFWALLYNAILVNVIKCP